jgi:hypothetical protein
MKRGLGLAIDIKLHVDLVVRSYQAVGGFGDFPDLLGQAWEATLVPRHKGYQAYSELKMGAKERAEKMRESVCAVTFVFLCVNSSVCLGTTSRGRSISADLCIFWPVISCSGSAAGGIKSRRCCYVTTRGSCHVDRPRAFPLNVSAA